ncbi:MAG: hypothetical protein H6652_21570 [Ardenticatenaceae bacterium]|nr:hypothetical protein [Ardenticatenaceae bacterium]
MSLSQYINHDEPFGPDSAELFEDDLDAYRDLFDTHNKLFNRLRNRPSFIIGRKGSGKTTYLNNVLINDDYDVIVSLQTNKALVRIIEVFQQHSTGLPFAEDIAELWESTLWISIFSKIRNTLKISADLKISINAYLSKIGVRDANSIDDVFWIVSDVLSENAGDKAIGMVAEILRRLDKRSFDETRRKCIEFFRENGHRAIILIDSLDDFRLEIDAVVHALQGLIKCVGSFRHPSGFVDVRFCLPAELYHVFQDISVNAAKDFRRQLILHWTAAELIILGANRLNKYLNLYFPDEVPKTLAKTISNKSDAIELFNLIFPHQIYNGLGTPENSVSYILRHTQLLPRQFLKMLNSIANLNRANSGNILKITEKDILTGVAKEEEILVFEVFDAFKFVHPKARQVCERCIPELPVIFSLGDLQRVFRTHGKIAMETDDFFKFKTMLIEVGIIGRVIMEEETDRYHKGLFEYTVPNRLVTATNDMFCVHPMFSRVFVSSRNRVDAKPIYPYGANLDDTDYRQF